MKAAKKTIRLGKLKKSEWIPPCNGKDTAFLTKNFQLTLFMFIRGVLADYLQRSVRIFIYESNEEEKSIREEIKDLIRHIDSFVEKYKEESGEEESLRQALASLDKNNEKEYMEIQKKLLEYVNNKSREQSDIYAEMSCILPAIWW